MFALTSRNIRQIIQKIRPIYTKCYDPVKQNAALSSNFSTGIKGGNMTFSKRLNNFEKRILVYNKNYPSIADVPDTVSLAVLNKAKDWTRVKISIWMIAFTVVGCIITVYFGRKAAKRGESIQKMNLEWHREYNEQAKDAELQKK